MPKFILVALLFAGLTAADVAAEQAGLAAPSLSSKKNYAEYWEQQFYFESGALLTSQFLITNLPISKHHGLMIASLKLPREPAVIIKNGRSRDGWTFNGTVPQISIFQHELKGRHPGFMMRLNNTAAEVDALFNAGFEPITLVEDKNALKLPSITLYAPTAQAFARWRAGPEIGGEGAEGDWLRLGHGRGYGLHVKQTAPLAEVLKRWVRVTPITSDGGFGLILHHFEKPDGQTRTAAILGPRFGAPLALADINLSGSIADGEIEIVGGGFKGALRPDEKLETFLVADQLNGIEKLVAGALANISRYRWLASYELEGTVNGRDYSLAGTAILEEILVGKPKRPRRRMRR